MREFLRYRRACKIFCKQDKTVCLFCFKTDIHVLISICRGISLLLEAMNTLFLEIKEFCGSLTTQTEALCLLSNGLKRPAHPQLCGLCISYTQTTTRPSPAPTSHDFKLQTKIFVQLTDKVWHKMNANGLRKNVINTHKKSQLQPESLQSYTLQPLS